MKKDSVSEKTPDEEYYLLAFVGVFIDKYMQHKSRIAIFRLIGLQFISDVALLLSCMCHMVNLSSLSVACFTDDQINYIYYRWFSIPQFHGQ